MSGKVYIVGSPIGNLGDVTLRALETLRTVSVVYAEDTRVSQKLLGRYEIKKPLRSFREAAPRTQIDRILQEIFRTLDNEEDIAYLSDAGTPGVSDPGQYLVERAVEAGYEVVPIPGASALSTLLSVAGLPIARPLFVGFLPKKKGHQTLMKSLALGLREEVCDCLVIYESPERIVKLLEELLEWNLPLEVCLGRELTKQFEEILRGSLATVHQELKRKTTIKGEISIIVWLKNEKHSI